MKTLRNLGVSLLLSGLFILVSAKPADDKGTEKLHSANIVLKEFVKMKESIPHQLLEEYQGIVIIPKLINAGLVVGGKRGKGIAMVKLPGGGWSDPVFVTLTGGSFGLQIGVQSVDLVLVFKNKGVLAKVKNGDFTIGGDISAAAGPVGRSSTASTDHKLQAEIYSYSRSKGLFAGISINGSNLAIDKDANAAFYGNTESSATIFESSKSTSPAVIQVKTTLSTF
jgi:lipid-binding SYLF domain-containing protein